MSDLNRSGQDTASSSASSGVISLLRPHENPSERSENFESNPLSLGVDKSTKRQIRTIPYFSSKHIKDESVQNPNKGQSHHINKEMGAPVPESEHLARNLKTGANLHNNRVIEVKVTENGINEETFPSNLHNAVSSPISNISAMKDALGQLGTIAASTIDSDGRLPLHLLSKNTVLITMLLNQEKYSPLYPGGYLQNNAPTVAELEGFICELLRLYPNAIICEDYYGKIPFLYAIDDWINNIRKRRSCETKDNEATESVASTIKRRSSDNTKQRPRRSLLELMRDSVNSNINAEGHDNLNNSNRSLKTVLSSSTIMKTFRPAYVDNDDAKSTGTRAAYRSKIKALEGDIEQTSSLYNKWAGKGLDLMEPTFSNDLETSNSYIPTSLHSSRRDGIDLKGKKNVENQFLSFDDCWSMEENDFPLDITVPPQVEWCIFMINTIYECIDHTDMIFTGNQGDTFLERSQVKEKLVTAVASIPSFVKFLVLLDPSDPASQRVLAFPIIKKTLLCEYAIGNWLVHLLEAANPAVVKRAVNYLELISELANEITLPKAGNDAFDKLSRLDYFLIAVLSISDVRELDRASGTRAVKYVLDNEIVKKKLPLLVLFDFSFLILLPLSFNSLVNDYLARKKSDINQVMFYTCLSCILYWILRGFSQMSTTKKVSRNAFLYNNFRLANLVNWSSIFMALGGTLCMEEDLHKGYEKNFDSRIRYLALTIIFLHFKVVCWLYTTNWQVAKRIRILREILRDLFWIVALFGIIFLSVSQAFHILSQPDCAELHDFCGVSDSYFHAYSVVLGQFDIKEFKSFLSAFLFVLFTFMTTVVVFNTITATVIHTHQKVDKALAANQICGHRARLVYIADAKSLFGLFHKMHAVTKFGSVLLFVVSSGTLFLFADVKVRDSFKSQSAGILELLIIVMMGFTLISIFILYSHMTSNSFKADEDDGKHRKNSVSKSNPIMTVLENASNLLLRLLTDVGSEKSINVNSRESLKNEAQQNAKSLDSSCVFKDVATPLQCYLKESSEQLKLDISVDIRTSEMKVRKAISDLKNTLMEKNVEI